MGIKFKLISLFLLIGIVPLVIVVSINYHNTEVGMQEQVDSTSSIIDKELTKELELIREIKKDTITQFFDLMKDQVIVLSQSQMVIDATFDFNYAFNNYEREKKSKGGNPARSRKSLNNYYNSAFTDKYKEKNDSNSTPDTPAMLSKISDNAALLQAQYISDNVYPLGSKENLTEVNDGTSYDKAHKKFHPIFKDYLKRFGYYDIFIVDSHSGNIVYSVFKELDYATSLKDGYFAESGIGKCFSQANNLNKKGSYTFVDLDTYTPSYEDAAGFIGAPIFAGKRKIGVLIFQIPKDKINTLAAISSDLGLPVNTMLVGQDRLLRSDINYTKDYTVDKVFRDKSLTIENEALDNALAGKTGVAKVKNVADLEAKVAYTPINVLGTDWALLSEMEISAITNDIEEIEAGASAMKRNLVKSASIAVIIAATLIILIAWYFSRWISIPLSRASANSATINESAKAVNVEITRIASSIDEMSNVIKEIAGNCDKAASVSVDAVKVAEESEERINSLNIVSDEIANVLTIISRIAEKTDLLALNATIEAAAAGEAGRGFSVVANEVQNLANQTSTATKEITEKITEIQLRSKESSESILKIADSNRNIEDVTTTLASAIEELSLTISDINSSVSEVSGETSKVTHGISEIAGEVTSITKGSKNNDLATNKQEEFIDIDDDNDSGLRIIGE